MLPGMTPEPRATAPELALDGGSEEHTEEVDGGGDAKLHIWAPRTGEVEGREDPVTRAKRDVRKPDPVSANGADLGTAPARSVAGIGVDEPVDQGVGDQRPDRRARRARRVVRVIRRIELWSVLKVALVVFTCTYVAALGAVVLLWGGANSTGLVDDLESFLGDVGFQDFSFDGELMFRRVAAIGGILVLTLSVLTVLFTSLVNLVSELTGGIRVIIIEEEPLEP